MTGSRVGDIIPVAEFRCWFEPRTAVVVGAVEPSLPVGLSGFSS